MKKVFFFAATALLLASCNDKTDEPADTQVALQVTAGIVKQTRAENASWESGDGIGIFMLDGSTALAAGRKYTTTGNGTFSPAALDQTIYYPMGDGQTVDFIAYYPYRSGQDDFTYPIDISDQSDQKALDFMTAAKVTGKSYAVPAVALTFAHRMARLDFTLVNGDGLAVADLDGIAVTVTDLYQNGTYDLNAGTFTASGSMTDLDMLVTNNGTRAQATIMPTSAATGRMLEFTLASNEVFRLDISDRAFDSGHKYLYTITLKRTETAFTATITDWTTETGTGTAD